MLQNPIHRFLGAIDQIHHTLWETNLLDELEDELHGHRHFFGGLDNVGVAGWQVHKADTRRGSCPGS